MKTLKVTPRNEEDIDKLVALLEEKDLTGKMEVEEEGKPAFRKLTTKDMALGIGRPVTNEELRDYMERHKPRVFIDMDEAFDDILNEPKKKSKKTV